MKRFTRRFSSKRSRAGALRNRTVGLSLVPVVLAITAGLAQAGEILGVLDPHSGILVPTASPAVAPAAAAPSVTRLGTFKFVINVVFGPEIPAGTSANGSVTIATSDPKFANMVTSTGSVARSGNTGALTLYLPYYWTVASATETVDINFNAGTFSAAGYYSYVRLLTVQLPKNGAQTPLTFDAGF